MSCKCSRYKSGKCSALCKRINESISVSLEEHGEIFGEELRFIQQFEKMKTDMKHLFINGVETKSIRSTHGELLLEEKDDDANDEAELCEDSFPEDDDEETELALAGIHVDGSNEDLCEDDSYDSGDDLDSQDDLEDT